MLGAGVPLLLVDLDNTLVDLDNTLVPDDTVTGALREAHAAGWVPFVVTNGTVQQQERKPRRTGLDRVI
jgi:putative hydrolase of the HAD superfamily